MSDKKISRFAILKDEHCCFGYYDETSAECKVCDASNDCVEDSDD